MWRMYRKLLRRRRLSEDLEAELAFHREMSAEHENAVGLGNPSVVKEQAFDIWRFNLVENLWRDILHAGRGLRGSPVLLISALLSLGLGIGANTAIFQLLDAVRLKTLPVQNPQELAEVQIAGGHGGMGINPGEYPELTRPIWEELRTNQRAFSGMFAWEADRMNVGEGSQLRNVRVLLVSGDFFHVLGVRPWRGRLISPEDEGACPARVAVASYSFWQNAMGGGALGRTSISRDYEIIGVTPPNFFGLSVGDSFDIALPLCREKELQANLFDIAVMGRLRPGWTIERASEQLKSISTGIFAATAPHDSSSQAIETYKRFKLTAVRAARGVSLVRERYNLSLWILFAITGLVLVIACANVANLLLARASTRDRETAVRLALGASRGRLLQQLFVEAGLLAALGAAFGIGLAPLLSRVLIWALSTGGNELSLPITLDWQVIVFTTVVSATACLLFGVAPARHALNAQPGSTLKGASRGMTASPRRFLAQRTLAVVQIAISVVLLVGAWLFVRSFQKLLTFNPGMREHDITMVFLAFQDARVAREHYIDYQQQLLERIRSTPGIITAASTTNLPLIGGSWEHHVLAGSSAGVSKFTWVSPGYFDTMDIPVIAGRDFESADTRSSLHVAIVNQTFVRHFFGNTNPIGRTLRTVMEPGYPSTLYQVIGIIPDTKYNSLWGVTPPMAFAPASQYPDPSSFEIVMVHAKIPTRTLMDSLKRELERSYPAVTATGGDFQKAIREGMVQERVMAILSGFFGLLAALLAAIGLYGVVSYLIASRWNELGVRLALGASPVQLISMVLQQVGTFVVLGILIGATLSLAAGRAATTLLFGLTPSDPISFVGASILLFGVSLLASCIPLRRALRLDPIVALRYE